MLPHRWNEDAEEAGSAYNGTDPEHGLPDHLVVLLCAEEGYGSLLGRVAEGAEHRDYGDNLAPAGQRFDGEQSP